jgi:parallel beta-helix repeat protein
MMYRTRIQTWDLGRVLLGLALAGCTASDQIAAPPSAATPSTAAADRLANAAAQRHTVRVTPGSSIQAAVNAVGADGQILIEPGVYREAVVVTAPGVSIQGLGSAGGVVIENPGDADNGIFVASTGDGFSLENVTVRDFEDNGVVLVGVDGFRLARVVTVNDGEYGLFPIQSTNGVIESCAATGHKDTGIYVGQSSDIQIRTSAAWGNVVGFELENTTRVSLTQSVAYDNTTGILVSLLPAALLQESFPGMGPPVVTATDNVVSHNVVYNNNHPNFADPEDVAGVLPPGSGIIVVGPDRVTVDHNTVTGNESVGIALVSANIIVQLAGLPPDVFGAVDPNPDQARIQFNTVLGNGTNPQPPLSLFFPGVDLLWDGSGAGNCWWQNRYGTSFPAQLPTCH